MRIILVGMPGSGKTTLGKQIAQAFRLRFRDADSFIVNMCKMRIPKIFETVGEQGFRQLEHIALKKMLLSDNMVLATGGGMPCFNKNMEVMNRYGTTVFIKPSADELFDRLRNSLTPRPLIENMNDEQLRAYISKTIETRYPFYEKAEYVYESDTDIITFLKDKLRL